MVAVVVHFYCIGMNLALGLYYAAAGGLLATPAMVWLVWRRVH